MAVGQRGRPKKFGEKLVKRHFELPESLSMNLDMAARATPDNPNGRDVVDIVREALLEKLSGNSARQVEKVNPDTNNAIQEIKNMFQEALAGVFRLRFNDREKGDLLLIARRFGYQNVEHLLEDMGKRALNSPVETEMFLFQGADVRIDRAQARAASVRENSTRDNSHRDGGQTPGPIPFFEDRDREPKERAA